MCVHSMIRFPTSGRVYIARHFPLPVARRVASVRRMCPFPLRGSWKRDKIRNIAVAAATKEEDALPGLTALLDSVKWKGNLVPVIVQNVDSGDILMQAFADRAAICETMQTKLATFYSRSREQRWCKGETSGNFITVTGVYIDCDRDSIIYLGDPVGPACHTGAASCWFSQIEILNTEQKVQELVSPTSRKHSPRTTLYALEDIIENRKQAALSSQNGQSSWTVKLLDDPELLCKKIREEANELCQTLEEAEGKERATEEMADLFYHSLVLLNKQGVPFENVLKTLRGRFGTSGIEEKRSRKKS